MKAKKENTMNAGFGGVWGVLFGGEASASGFSSQDIILAASSVPVNEVVVKRGILIS